MIHSFLAQEPLVSWAWFIRFLPKKRQLRRDVAKATSMAAGHLPQLQRADTPSEADRKQTARFFRAEG